VAGSDTPTATHYSPRPSGFELPGPHDFSTPRITLPIYSNCDAQAQRVAETFIMVDLIEKKETR
jgi:hypothetical protein